MAKCIVCGCTDRRACPTGCSWVLRVPPVCSECVNEYLIARAGAIIFEPELNACDSIAADLHELKAIYSLSAKRGFGPPMRQIRAINRRAMKSRVLNGAIFPHTAKPMSHR